MRLLVWGFLWIFPYFSSTEHLFHQSYFDFFENSRNWIDVTTDQSSLMHPLINRPETDMARPGIEPRPLASHSTKELSSQTSTWLPQSMSRTLLLGPHRLSARSIYHFYVDFWSKLACFNRKSAACLSSRRGHHYVDTWREFSSFSKKNQTCLGRETNAGRVLRRRALYQRVS